jgi:hypothetical protein
MAHNPFLPTTECHHGRHLNSAVLRQITTGTHSNSDNGEGWDPGGWNTSLALTSPRREVEWTRFDQSAGHVKPFNWSCYHCSSVFLLLSDGELRNSGVVRDDTPWWEGRDCGPSCMAPVTSRLIESGPFDLPSRWSKGQRCVSTTRVPSFTITGSNTRQTCRLI